MAVLPVSIETYLIDAGFSATELLIIKNLLEGEAMTLRVLGGKTGKSTGVLDQAVKKLLSRRIITKETVNDAPKIALASLDAVLRWMQEDMRRTVEKMQSRNRDFESFVASVRRESRRPEFEFFEGKEGIMKAYQKLLTGDATAFLHYFPVACREEDDPLRDFRVQYFRERRRRGIFSRVLAEDSSLGRRFQSRDAFEYRQTILLPAGDLPFTFEKIIAGSAIACFHHAAERACIIRYPEFAATERDIFDALWKSTLRSSSASSPADAAVPTTPQPAPIPLRTRVLSSVREFFLSRKSIVAFIIFALASAAVTVGLYYQNYHLNIQRERERAMSIVATGAMQFDVKDLDQLRILEDYKKPEYAKVVKKLNEIRNSNPGVAYAYLMRPAEGKEGYWEYIADADSIDPFAKMDSNFDGVIDERDQLQYPGFLYDEFDPYFKQGISQTFSTPDIHSDQFGMYFTTSSPIRDSSGKPVALLNVDIKIEQISLMTIQSFDYFLCFIGIFFLLAFMRYAAVNKSLLLEIWKVIQKKGVHIFLLVSILLAFIATFGVYRYSYSLSLLRIRDQVKAIAATAVTDFKPSDIDELRTWRDAEKQVYRDVVLHLQSIRSRNPSIKYVYIMRPTSDASFYEFVADADSLDIRSSVDLNGNGLKDDTAAPGQLYLASGSEFRAMSNASKYPLADEKSTIDLWGTWISGYAPILDQNGASHGFLGIDMDATAVADLSRQSFNFALSFAVFFLLFVLLWLFVSNHRWFLKIFTIFNMRKKTGVGNFESSVSKE